MSKVLLVAQAPSRSMEPGARPFEGARVLGRFAGYLGVVPAEVYELFDVVNLIETWPGPAAPGSKYDAFPRDQAEVGALRVRQMLVQRSEYPWSRVVTLGRAVTTVFWGDRRGLGRLEWFEWVGWPRVDLPFSVLGAASPHPGGTSMFWNKVDDRARAVKFWRELRDYARQ